MRVRLIFQNSDSSEAGSRFYLSYAGSAPSGANCLAIGVAIGDAWNTNLAPLTHSEWYLKEIDVLDIATETGSSGVTSVDYNGSADGTLIPASVAVNVEYDIARRYRGGKPRMFHPQPDASKLLDAGHWTTDFVADFNTAIAAFFTAVEAIDVGAVGALAHVNLSYYKGFTNITNSSGRERAVPTYRSVALLDTIEGYATKSVVGSQRRRRTATTP